MGKRAQVVDSAQESQPACPHMFVTPGFGCDRLNQAVWPKPILGLYSLSAGRRRVFPPRAWRAQPRPMAKTRRTGRADGEHGEGIASTPAHRPHTASAWMVMRVRRNPADVWMVSMVPTRSGGAIVPRSRRRTARSRRSMVAPQMKTHREKQDQPGPAEQEPDKRLHIAPLIAIAAHGQVWCGPCGRQCGRPSARCNQGRRRFPCMKNVASRARK